VKPLSELLDPLDSSTTQALDNIELERTRLSSEAQERIVNEFSQLWAYTAFAHVEELFASEVYIGNF